MTILLDTFTNGAPETLLAHIPNTGNPWTSTGIDSSQVAGGNVRNILEGRIAYQSKFPFQKALRAEFTLNFNYQKFTTIAVGGQPSSVAVGASFAYVTNYIDNTVSVIDTATKAVVTTIVGFSQPVAAVLSPDTSTVYVVNIGGNSVSVIDTATNVITNTISFLVGSEPYRVIFNNAGTKAYVTLRGTGKIKVITTSTHTLLSTISLSAGVGCNPRPLAISNDDATLFVGTVTNKSIVAINTTTEVEITSEILPELLAPAAFVISPDGTKLYVGADDVAIVGYNVATPLGAYTDYTGIIDTVYEVTGLHFAGNLLLVGSFDAVRIFDYRLSTLVSLSTSTLNLAAASLGVSPDKKTLWITDINLSTACAIDLNTITPHIASSQVYQRFGVSTGDLDVGGEIATIEVAVSSANSFDLAGTVGIKKASVVLRVFGMFAGSAIDFDLSTPNQVFELVYDESNIVLKLNTVSIITSSIIAITPARANGVYIAFDNPDSPNPVGFEQFNYTKVAVDSNTPATLALLAATANGAISLTDTFNGVGTLGTHIADTGQSWLNGPTGYSGSSLATNIILSGTGYITSDTVNGVGGGTADYTIPTNDYFVEYFFSFNPGYDDSYINASNTDAQFHFNYNIATEAGYVVEFANYYEGALDLQLLNSAYQPLGKYGIANFNYAIPHVIRVEVTALYKKVFLDGSCIIIIQDATIPGPGTIAFSLEDWLPSAISDKMRMELIQVGGLAGGGGRRFIFVA